MEYDDIDLLVIHVLLGVMRLVRKSQGGQKSKVVSLEIRTKEPTDGKHDFWVAGKELFQNENMHLPFSGQIRCNMGRDYFWTDGHITGDLFIQGVGKCPFRIKHVAGKSPQINVRIESGTYRYTSIGGFEI